jgi:hypothetical protein
LARASGEPTITESAPTAIALETSPAVGDHVDVLAGLEHVLGAGRRDVGDCRRLGDADAEHAARRARRARTDANQDADRASPHQVQAGRVGGAATDHGRHRHLGDELLQVERLDSRRDVFGRDHRALDDEDVDSGLDRDLVVVADLLRSQRATGDGAALLDLGDPLTDQLRLDRLGVDLLHQPRRLVDGRGGDLLQLLLGVLEARPDPLQVEHAEPAELVDEDGGVGADHPVHRRGDKRQLEAIRAEGPADVNVVGIACAARRDDRDVVESVGAPPLLAPTDVDLQLGPPGWR